MKLQFLKLLSRIAIALIRIITGIFFLFQLQCMQPQEGSFPFKRFEKYNNNPILFPQGDGFERDRVYNPTVIVEHDTLFMIYRAEGKGTGTGVFGLAWSKDGINFNRYSNNPIMKAEHEFENLGCEDPRIIKDHDQYFMYYNGADGKKTPGNICLATSNDLIHWEKQGEILQPSYDWEKIQIKAPAPVPQKIGGKYWMYYQGEKEAWKTKMGLVFSEDLIHWTPVSDEPVMKPREDYFDSWGVEPGVAVVMSEGILLIYNGWGGDSTTTNKIGWALFSEDDPAKLIARCDSPLISYPHGHVFAEALVRFNDKWFLYYGAADRWIEGAIIDFGEILSATP